MKPQNTYRNLPKQSAAEKPSPAGSSFQFDSSKVLKILPHIIFVAVFGIVYIANRHYTERMVRQITKLKAQVEELRVDYTTLNAAFMQERNENNILLKAKQLDLKGRNKTQYKIKLED
ncbi:MAG: FtsL-like putative cell division protein [Bacteroidota bacterium]